MKLIKSLLRKRRKKESLFKYLMSILHLWLGLLSSIVIFIVCLTGSIYAFKNQIIDAWNYDKVNIAPQNKPFLTYDSLRTIFLNEGMEITQLVIPNQPDKSLQVTFSKPKTKEMGNYYVNPYTGEILGKGDYSLESFFRIVLDIHRTLMISRAGKQIVGASILIFVFMLLSGLVLW
ncbi:MAG TPA: PepSY-associated TM helix domain-containing protein, partial [Cytophagaceae bacterium]